MTTAKNRELVRSFFDALNRNDQEGLSALMTDDLQWWIVGNIKISGTKDKRSILLGFKLLHRVFEGFRFELLEFTAEDDRVAVTAETHAKHPSGRQYNNHYHFLFTVRGEQVAHVKEYFDTQHALWIEHGD